MGLQLSSFSSSSPSSPVVSATSAAARGRMASTTPDTLSPLVQGSTTPGRLLNSPLRSSSTTSSPRTQPCFLTRGPLPDRQCHQRIKCPRDNLLGTRKPTDKQTADSLNWPN